MWKYSFLEERCCFDPRINSVRITLRRIDDASDRGNVWHDADFSRFNGLDDVCGDYSGWVGLLPISSILHRPSLLRTAPRDDASSDLPVLQETAWIILPR